MLTFMLVLLLAGVGIDAPSQVSTEALDQARRDPDAVFGGDRDLPRSAGYRGGRFSPCDRGTAELQLAHVEHDEVSAAYNFAIYLPARRKMTQAWADYLENSRKIIFNIAKEAHSHHSK